MTFIKGNMFCIANVKSKQKKKKRKTKKMEERIEYIFIVLEERIL